MELSLNCPVSDSSRSANKRDPPGVWLSDGMAGGLAGWYKYGCVANGKRMISTSNLPSFSSESLHSPRITSATTLNLDQIASNVDHLYICSVSYCRSLKKREQDRACSDRRCKFEISQSRYMLPKYVLRLVPGCRQPRIIHRRRSVSRRQTHSHSDNSRRQRCNLPRRCPQTTRRLQLARLTGQRITRPAIPDHHSLRPSSS